MVLPITRRLDLFILQHTKLSKPIASCRLGFLCPAALRMLRMLAECKGLRRFDVLGLLDTCPRPAGLKGFLTDEGGGAGAGRLYEQEALQTITRHSNSLHLTQTLSTGHSAPIDNTNPQQLRKDGGYESDGWTTEYWSTGY